MSQTAHYVTAVQTQLNNVPQQEQSMLTGCVNYEPNHSSPGTSFFLDDRGKTDPKESQGKGGRIEPRELDGTRVGGHFYGDEDWFYEYNEDKVRMLLDPQNEDVRSLVMGKERKKDQDIVNNALFGTTYQASGDGDAPLDTPLTLPNSQIIAVNDRQYLHDEEAAKVATSGSLHLTIGKLILAKTMLGRSHVRGKRYIACDEFAKANLLSTIPATSQFYAGAVKLYEGEIDHFLGFTFKEFSSEDGILPTYTAAGNYAASKYAAWIDNGVYYKERPITNVSVQKDITIKGHPTQVYYKRERAWARRYPKAVVQILCTQAKRSA